MSSWLLVVALCLGAFSCRTESPEPTTPPDLLQSTWTIDTSVFVTYYTFVSGANGAVILSGAADNNTGSINRGSNFSITFHLPYIPAHGSYVLDCSDESASSACMEVSYQGISYRPKTMSSTAYLKADSTHQRAKITLLPTWFYSTLLTGDSVSVAGTFYQP